MRQIESPAGGEQQRLSPADRLAKRNSRKDYIGILLRGWLNVVPPLLELIKQVAHCTF
jgi:hypothetical protein